MAAVAFTGAAAVGAGFVMMRGGDKNQDENASMHSQASAQGSGFVVMRPSDQGSKKPSNASDASAFVVVRPVGDVSFAF